MYSHGHDRRLIDPGDAEDGMMYKQVYDEANMNWIEYVESEKDRDTWMPGKNCFYLKIGD